MRILRQPFRIIRAHSGAYLAMNAYVYGLVLVGMASAFLFPDVQTSTLVDTSLGSVLLTILDDVVLLGLMIFAVNTLVVAVLVMVLPSLAVPFLGLVPFGYMAFAIGRSLAPVNEAMAWIMIPHGLTLLIEMQAYALVAFGVFQLGRFWLSPKTADAPNRRQAYLRGLRQLGWVSLPAFALLVIGAVYEAVEIIYLLPLMPHG